MTPIDTPASVTRRQHLAMADRGAVAPVLSRLRVISDRLATPLDVPLALFALSSLTGLRVAYDPSLSWAMLTAILLSLLAYYLVIYATSSSVPVRTLAVISLLPPLALALYFITQYGHFDYPHKLGWLRYPQVLVRLLPHFTPFHPHANSVATSLEGWIPLSAALALTARRRGLGLALSGCMVVLAAAVLLSASRGAWLALALCVPLWWATRSRRNLLLVAIAGLALAIGATGYFVLSREIGPGNRGNVWRALPSFLVRPDRLDVYRGSWYLIQDFPFTGIGLGETFAMMYSRYVLLIRVPYLTYAHNLFLHVWLAQGLLGFLAFLALVGAFVVVVCQTGRRGSAVFQGAWLGVAATLLHGLSDARQYADPWTLVSLFVLLGLAISAAGKLRQRPVSGIRRAWRVGTLAGLGLLAVLLLVARRPLTSQAYANAGALSQARGELVDGLTAAQRSTLLAQARLNYLRALASDPRDRTAHQRLGLLALDAQTPSEAVAHLEAALQTAPTNSTTRKALGLAYTWEGHLHQAARILEDAPGIAEELNAWGWWWMSQSKYGWAANAYRVSLLLDPDQPYVREALATVPAH